MQRDVPGIDHSFLAMDTEEGVEVVWNEVQFSERKSFKSQEVLNSSQNISCVQEVYILLSDLPLFILLFPSAVNLIKFQQQKTASEKISVICLASYNIHAYTALKKSKE